MNTFQRQAVRDFIEQHQKEFYEGLPSPVLYNFSIQLHYMTLAEAARVLWCFFPCAATLHGADITPSLVEDEIRYLEDEIADNAFQ